MQKFSDPELTSEVNVFEVNVNGKIIYCFLAHTTGDTWAIFVICKKN